MEETIKTTAQAYESQSVGNIADLQKVSTDLKVETKSGTNEKGEAFIYKVVKVDGNEYRVPLSVIRSLKAILEDNPNLQYFKVRKSGQGMDTTYTVIPLQ